MTTRATETVTSAGLEATYFTPTASDLFTPGSILHVKNDNAGTLTVTLVTTMTVDGNAVADKTISILTTEERFIDIPTDRAYRRDADGLVEAQFSVTTSVSAAVVARP